MNVVDYIVHYIHNAFGHYSGAVNCVIAVAQLKRTQITAKDRKIK